MSHRDRDDYRRDRDRRGPPPRGDRNRDRGDRYKDTPPPPRDRDRDRLEARSGRDPGRSKRTSRSRSPPRRDGDRDRDKDRRERDGEAACFLSEFLAYNTDQIWCV